jgi:hypothetical protein
MDQIDPGTGKPFTADQKTAGKFAVGMERGIENMDKLASEGFDEAALNNQVMKLFNKKEKLSRVDILNIAKTPQQRRYLQAQLDFMVPHLRDQSGAAINKDEYTTEAAQYHPLVGDDAETIAQKRNARYSELAARKAAAGGAYDNFKKAEAEELAKRNAPKPKSPQKPQDAGVQKISSKDEYDKLPSGAEYISAKTGLRSRKP